MRILSSLLGSGVLVGSLVLASAASASPITVSSYDMLNGNSGSYNYWDQSYVGTSPAVNSTTDNAQLIGGKGDLTDGIIATNNWFVDEAPAGNGPYVGWAINPTITFRFAGGTTVNSISFYLDDSNGNGSVLPPGSIDINGTNYSVTDPPSGAPFVFTVNGLALTGDITTTLNRSGGWVFLSEVSFDGGARVAAVPEPLTLSLFGAGVVGIAALRRRKSAKSA